MYISHKTVQRLERVQRLLDQLRPDAPPQALLVPGSHQKPRGDIIVFTGAFNPPTIAHIALLQQGHRYGLQHGATHIYAAFTKVTINKERLERPILLDRVQLLQLLLRRRLPHAGILLFNRGLYVEQARAIRDSFPGVRRIYFLMGYDKIVQIFDPRYYQNRDAELADLFHAAHMLVAPRGNDDEPALKSLLARPENRPFAPYVQSIPFDPLYRNISSTQVRQGHGSNDSAVPQEVRQFMRKTRAYAPPVHKKDGTEVDTYKERLLFLNRLMSKTSSN